MKIRNISIRDIYEGKNWRFVPPDSDDWLKLPMEEWEPIEEATEFQPGDRVVYSGLSVYSDGRIKPIVCLKEVQDLDYGGDYCEFVGGQWQQVGLIPNPNAELGYEYIANPLAIDPSFDTPDNAYREYHRNGFQRYATGLQSEF